MAAQREPRRTAGNRMSKVMEDQLEEDEFYKTTYGGFGEEVEDNEYQSNEDNSEDEVDSDFDISENDELISDGEEGKPKRKKRAGVQTKAYKEPVKKSTSETSTKKEPAKKSQKHAAISNQTKPNTDSNFMRKSSRRSTAANSNLINAKLKKRQQAEKKKENVKKPVAGVRRLTQEELMAEAERTERKNLKSLMNYQRMEEKRKKSSVKKRILNGSTIKYISTTVPDVSCDDPEKHPVMSRDFIVFSDHMAFDKQFQWMRARPTASMVCPVTQKKAKYIDPLTKIPYHNLQAFKMIRQAYAMAPESRRK